MPIVVPPWTIGQRLKASALNVLNSAITEAQATLGALGSSIIAQQAVWAAFNARAAAIENATGVFYSGLVGAIAENDGVGTQNFGTFPSFGGFSASGGGVGVPSTGVYAVTAYIFCSTGSWSGRTFHQIVTGSQIIARQSVPPGTEANTSVSGITGRITAGTVITPQYFTAAGGDRNCGVQMTIIRVSA